MSADKSQKTVKPSAKRIREFRKEGKIAFSRDLVSVSGMLLGGMIGVSFSSSAYQSMSAMLAESLRAGEQLPAGAAQTLLAVFLSATAPVAIGALVGVVLAGCLQLGWPPALKRPTMNFGKILSPQSLLQAVAPKPAAGRVFKATAKVALVLWVLYFATKSEFLQFLGNPALESSALASRLGSAGLRLGFYSILVLGLVAATDYLVQRRRIGQEMMMTPDEAKREHKQQEGDPQIKSKRRARAREMSKRRLSLEVAKADVVLVNPTHFAVALRYDSAKAGAPIVVAKGADHLAEKIREYARRAGVPILSRPPLTRLIYKLVPEGREVPAQLYQAIAEILAYVYRLGLRSSERNAR